MSKDRRSPRETDLSRVRTVPIAIRPNKVRAEEFATAPGAVEFGVKRGRKTVNIVRTAHATHAEEVSNSRV